MYIDDSFYDLCDDTGLSIVTGENTENGEQVDANATNTAEAPNPPPNTGQSEADTKGQDECILFVGDLARNLTESELEHAFSRCGKVLGKSCLSFLPFFPTFHLEGIQWCFSLVGWLKLSPSFRPPL